MEIPVEDELFDFDYLDLPILTEEEAEDELNRISDWQESVING